MENAAFELGYRKKLAEFDSAVTEDVSVPWWTHLVPWTTDSELSAGTSRVPKGNRDRIAEFYRSNTLPMKKMYSPEVVGSAPGSLDFTEDFPDLVRYIDEEMEGKNGYVRAGAYGDPIIHYNRALIGNPLLQNVLVHEFEHALARRSPSKIYTQDERSKLRDAYGISQDIARSLGTDGAWYDESAATNAEFRFDLWNGLYSLLGRAPSLSEYSDYLKGLSLGDIRKIYMEGEKNNAYLAKAVEAAKKRYAEENGPAPTLDAYPEDWRRAVRVVLNDRKVLPGEMSIADAKNTDWYKKAPELFDKAISEDSDGTGIQYVTPADVLLQREQEDYNNRMNESIYSDDKMEAARTAWGEVAKNTPNYGGGGQVVA